MEIIPMEREFDSERERDRMSSQTGDDEGTGEEGRELGPFPNHPNVKVIPSQTLSNKTLYFQEKWFKDHTWLHYSPSVKGVLCYYCAKYFAAQKSKLASKADSAFVKTGFNNWKKALEKFSAHKDSQCHKLAVMTRLQEPKTVNVQLSRELERQQQQARRNLMKIAGGVQYLARQGLAFQGDEKESGNFSQLLKYKAKGDAELTNWLKRQFDFTSPKMQNELLQLMANTIIKKIVSDITSMPVVQFALIIDGTQDVSGVEQESICVRFVDADLQPKEEFLGLYEVLSTTGENIAKVACDVMTRLDLPLSQLRGQTYDGAANMAGRWQGVQAILRAQQPLAVYCHCGPHCVNLITQAACLSSPLVRDSMALVHELGGFFNQSGKFKLVFQEIAKSEHGFTSLKPLCPTRWTVRTPAIHSVLRQYESVLTALEEMASSSSSETSAKANGLHGAFLKGNTVLGLVMAEDLMGDLECLNTSLQHRKQTVSGMLKAVDHVKTSMQEKRTEEHFDVLFSKATAMATKLDLQPIQMPHIRKPTKRYTGQASAHIHPDAQSFYRAQFYNTLDTVNTQFIERFDQAGFHKLQQLENVLLQGTIDEVVDQYPELNPQLLQVQLAMFAANYTYETSSDVVSIMHDMVPEVRSLFSQVEALLRLLLIVPASSAEAERSFSALRRLKTWLRSSMTQSRLNHVAICHVHQRKLDELDLEDICQSFISANDRRKKAFGSFSR
ncbi:zinc finger MYM-type protein 1-like [Paralichthys olivaceus]|uniref:zinc finger MYM-type protein 1-like n=1 Tax=Paralichthys olivaceus TaxID=8255 RepID=UPI0037539382